MDGKASELSVMMELIEARRKLKAIEAKVVRLEGQVEGSMRAYRERMQDLKLVSQRLTETAEFGAWLMDQDLSSAHWSKLSDGTRRIVVEGKSDVDLALDFAEGRGQ